MRPRRHSQTKHQSLISVVARARRVSVLRCAKHRVRSARKRLSHLVAATVSPALPSLAPPPARQHDGKLWIPQRQH